MVAASSPRRLSWPAGSSRLPDRTRLTADGQIRSCLFSTEETDLRRLLRGGADDDAIEAAWRAAMWSKPAGHGINAPDFIQPDRPMSAIGG